MTPRRVSILATSAVLAEALRHLVASLPHPAVVLADEGPAPGDVVLAPVADCLPPHCEELTSIGARVIILASLPRDREREGYERAGAWAYVTMAVDTAELRSTLEAALAADPHPAV